MIWRTGLVVIAVVTSWVGFGSCGRVEAVEELYWYEVRSPDRSTTVGVALRQGIPVYSVWYEGACIIEPSMLELDLDDPFEVGLVTTGGSSMSTRTSWEPVYGERDRSPLELHSRTIELREKGKRARRLQIELRAYDEGVAFRYLWPEQENAKTWRIKQERSEFRFAPGSRAYPIYGTEQTFSTEPVAVSDLKPGAHMPLTVSLPNGFASVLEACVVNYSRMRLGKTSDGALVSQLMGPVEVSSPCSSPWRVILLGRNEGQLIEHEGLIPKLNPHYATVEMSWVKPGKTISDHGNVPLKTEELKKVVDFASANGIRYLQLDWGWYGTEWAWSDQERDTFRKTRPDLAADSDWVVNTRADPFKVAKGPVPYRPDWKNVTQVDLDMPELIRYAKERGVGVCLYIEANRTLREVDMDRLFATYESWGVAGLKPGFVRYGSQENTEWIRRMVRTAAEHRLWLCIHDAYVPDGMEGPWPNLMISEGGGGQEGNHPASHDVMLPFTRCLAGPFDYTPCLYTQGKSHAHMLAFLVVYYGPAQTIRGGYRAWNTSGPGRGGSELEFLKRVPTTWDETKVLSAQIGRWIVVARRSGQTWFIGGMAGDKGQTLELTLDFLTPDRSYGADIYRDDPSAASEGWCPARREVKAVKAGDTLGLVMEKAGGFVAILEPNKE